MEEAVQVRSAPGRCRVCRCALCLGRRFQLGLAMEAKQHDDLHLHLGSRRALGYGISRVAQKVDLFQTSGHVR